MNGSLVAVLPVTATGVALSPAAAVNFGALQFKDANPANVEDAYNPLKTSRRWCLVLAAHLP